MTVLNWIDQQVALDDLVAIIGESPAVTLDTETGTRQTHVTYSYRLGLVVAGAGVANLSSSGC